MDAFVVRTSAAPAACAVTSNAANVNDAVAVYIGEWSPASRKRTAHAAALDSGSAPSLSDSDDDDSGDGEYTPQGARPGTSGPSSATPSATPSLSTGRGSHNPTLNQVHADDLFPSMDPKKRGVPVPVEVWLTVVAGQDHRAAGPLLRGGEGRQDQREGPGVGGLHPARDVLRRLRTPRAGGVHRQVLPRRVPPPAPPPLRLLYPACA